MTPAIKKRIKAVKAGRIPTGYKKTKVGIVPKEWDIFSLKDISTELHDAAGKNHYEPLSISAGIGFVNQTNKFGKDISGAQYAKYTVIKKNDFSYNKGNSKKYPQGCIYRLKDREIAVVPNVFESFRLNCGEPKYFEQLFISGFFNRQLFSKINHGVRNDGLLNLRGDDFYSSQILFPPLSEQKKIAEILSAQDKIIELKEKLIAEKQRQKKYLMQVLLDENIKKTPFKINGIKIDKKKWEKKKIGEIAKLSSGNTPRRNDSQNFKGNVCWLSSGELKQKYINDTEEKISKIAVKSSNLCLYKSGTVIIALYGLEAIGIRGTCSILKVECTISQACMAFTEFKSVLNEYFYYWYLFNGYAIGAKYAQGSKQQNINSDLMSSLIMLCPPFHEQQAIAAVLSTADEEISLLQRDLEQEKLKKKALSQVLLSGIVRVNNTKEIKNA